MAISFRPIEESDKAWLSALYASTRQEELAVVPWPDEMKAAFLQQQFDAQHFHYMKHYPDAKFDIILQNGEMAGRLYVQREAANIHVIDISLIPAFRNQGIGSQLFHELFAEAKPNKQTVTIHVEVNNPAMRLYHRLGFQKISETGIYWLMEWRDKEETA